MANYDKVIIHEVDGEKKVAVIFDTKTHVPVFFKLDRCGMDEVLDILNKGDYGKKE